MIKTRLAVTGLLIAALAAGCGDSGNNQTGATGAQLADPLTVKVQDSSGTPATGVGVSWVLVNAAGPNAMLSSGSTPTGADGQTSIMFVLGSTAGPYSVRASIAGSSVTFDATASAGAELEIVSGDTQVGFAGSALAQPFVVRAFETGGAPLSGVEVTFSIVEEQGTGAALSATSATTAVDGQASSTLTLGDSNGRYQVTADAGSSSVQFSANGCGGDGAAAVLNLAPGADAVLGPAEVSCVQLPAHSAGAEYEVAVTPLPQALGFNDMELAIAGSVAGGGPQVVPPPSGGRSSASFSLGGQATGRELAWRVRQYEWDQQLRRTESQLLPQIRSNAGRVGFGLMAVPSVGDTLDFGFSCTAAFPNAPDSITGVVRSVSAKAVVIEDTVADGAFTPAEYDAIAQNFDDLIFDTDTTYFGAPGDVDANGDRVVLLYSAGVNNLSDSYDQGFIAGFFCPADLSAFGNNAEMFYVMVPDPSGEFTPDDPNDGIDKSFVERTTERTVAHEFQHMLNTWVRANAGLFQMDVGLNEGLSHLAEELVGHAANGFTPGTELGPSELIGTQQALDNFNKYYIDDFLNLATYLVEPADTSALLNSEDPLGVSTFRMRGANWAFVRYLLDRFDTGATEWQKTRALITDAAPDSRDAVSSVFGTPFNGLAAEWSGIFAVEDRTDLGGPPRAELLLSSYQLRTFYEHPSIVAFIDGTLSLLGLPQPGGYPLRPMAGSLAGSSTVDARLFTATAQYVTLTAPAGSGGTGLRLQATGSGADLPASLEPRMVIVRTK
jgi:hypothetical protein